MKFEIDELKLYFGEDYQINDQIIIHQPTIWEIMDYGEREYFSMVSTLTANPSDMKGELWECGIDYETLGDFDLFLFLSKSFPTEKTYLLLGDLDFSKFEFYLNQTNEETVLYCQERDLVIDRSIYELMVSYIRKIHGFESKKEVAGNTYTKNFLLDEATKKLKNRDSKPFHSILKPLISAMVNSSEFKYNIQTIKDLKIVQFMDSVERIQKIKSSTALLHGLYGGFIDGKNIDKKELNWLSELH